MTANAGLCEQARSAALNTAISKFLLAMGGVVLSSLIIFVGLTLYNNVFVRARRHSVEDEILRTPRTTDEAIKFFIHKNKLNWGKNET